MTRLSTLLGRSAVALMLGSAFLLGGCQKQAVKDHAVITQWQGQFDTTIKAYKEGQFLVDGAVLSAIDTGSHFAYLKDIHKLPRTVLLVPSEDSGVRKVHLQYMARMALDYGFAVYYDKKGELVQITAVNTKARELQDHHAPVKISDGQECKSAAGCDRMDQSAQQQR